MICGKLGLPKKVCAFTLLTTMLKEMSSFMPHLLPDFADRTKLAMIKVRKVWIQCLVISSSLSHTRDPRENVTSQNFAAGGV